MHDAVEERAVKRSPSVLNATLARFHTSVCTIRSAQRRETKVVLAIWIVQGMQETDMARMVMSPQNFHQAQIKLVWEKKAQRIGLCMWRGRRETQQRTWVR